MHRISLIPFVALLVAGCSQTSNTSEEESESDRPKTGYEQSLDRAREVESKVEQAQEDRKRKLEEAEGGG